MALEGWAALEGGWLYWDGWPLEGWVAKLGSAPAGHGKLWVPIHTSIKNQKWAM